jgi:hypothetical protein
MGPAANGVNFSFPFKHFPFGGNLIAPVFTSTQMFTAVGVGSGSTAANTLLAPFMELPAMNPSNMHAIASNVGLDFFALIDSSFVS